MKRSSKDPPIKLRVIYNDPDATDLSGDEVENINHPKNRIAGSKRVVKAISCLSLKNDVADSKKPRRSSSIFQGVRRRPSGKFSSEIRLNKKRIWLGTYCTEEEASAVYQAKKREFEEMTMAAAKEKNESTTLCSLLSPSSVLEKVSSNLFEDEESIEDLWKDEPSIMELLEAPCPSASESMEELFRPYAQEEDYLSFSAVNCQWLLPMSSDDGNLIDLFGIKMKLNNDLDWVDEFLNLEDK